MSETLVAQLQSLRDRIANDPRSAEMFEADCDVLLDAISRIKAYKLRQLVKDKASSVFVNRIAALEAELAQARAECERLMKLVMAVGNKYPGESRYDTAMRYIVEAETRVSGPGQSAARKEGTK